MDILIITLIIFFVLCGLLSLVISIRSFIADEKEGFAFYSKSMIICWAIALFGAIGFQMIGK